MLLSKDGRAKYDELYKKRVVLTSQRTGPLVDLVDLPAGDGEYGVLEGFNSTIRHDGSQLVRWWLRSDSNGESALAFALRSKLDGHERSARVAGNLLDWVYFKSDLFKTDPAGPQFGLVHWAHDSDSLYGDNDIKIILSCMGTAALLGEDRWDEVMLQNITANFRTTGTNGFRGGSLQNLKGGWRRYWSRDITNFAPHYEAWIWASYLWAYDKTRDPVFLERTRKAVRLMMEAYPDQWTWTNGIQQERGRMLLTLAWLIRVDDQPEYRAWLKRLATTCGSVRIDCGAIREELGNLGKGDIRRRARTRSTASTRPRPSTKTATPWPTCSIPATSPSSVCTRPTPPRATRSIGKWPMGWPSSSSASRFGARPIRSWTAAGSAPSTTEVGLLGLQRRCRLGRLVVEVGWTKGWIPTVLAMRELDLNLWDLTKDSKIGRHWEKTKARCCRRRVDDEARLPMPESARPPPTA